MVSPSLVLRSPDADDGLEKSAIGES